MFHKFFKMILKGLKFVNKIASRVIDESVNTIIYAGGIMLGTKFAYNVIGKLIKFLVARKVA